MSQVKLTVTPQVTDRRSAEFQCSLTVENTGQKRLRIISLRPLLPAGARLQQVIDTGLTSQMQERDKLYADLSTLLSDFLHKESGEYRSGRSQFAEATGRFFRGLVRLGSVPRATAVATAEAVRWMQLRDTRRAWGLRVLSADDAASYYESFLKPKAESNKDLSSLFLAKIAAAKRLESVIGETQRADYVADLDPASTYTRIYVFNCERRWLNPKTYTMSFDCALTSAEAAETTNQAITPEHHGASISNAVSPRPVVLNAYAAMAALLGMLLHLALGSPPKIGPAEPSSIIAVLEQAAANGPTVVAVLVAAVFFFNIYDSTDIGRKLDVGVGWRSALIIGGLAGLLNDKVVKALQGLLG
jgi:hypothetical protein